MSTVFKREQLSKSNNLMFLFLIFLDIETDKKIEKIVNRIEALEEAVKTLQQDFNWIEDDLREAKIIDR